MFRKHQWQFSFIWLLITLSIFVSTTSPVSGDTPLVGQCYDAKGNLIKCPGTGQDGDTMAGLAWPEPRFVDNRDGTVTDKLTNLMWLRDAGCITKSSWQGSVDTVKEFIGNPDKFECVEYSADYDDWTVPTILELESFFNAEVPNLAEWLNNSGFINARESFYWSNTLYANPYNAWVFSLQSGEVLYLSKLQYHNVWPVRAVPGEGVKVPAVETVSPAGSDVVPQRGIARPSPRFTDNGDGTVTDNLTRLMWLKSPNFFAGTDWETALQMIKTFNTVPMAPEAKKGAAAPPYNDWRLPNRNELASIISRLHDFPALPDGQPFTGLQSSYYWTSTTLPGDSVMAWSAHQEYGDMTFHAKDSTQGVWPVRSLKDGDGPLWKTAFWKAGLANTYMRLVREGAGEEVEPLTFTDSGDGTITNNLTGQVWLKDAGCFGKVRWDMVDKAFLRFNHKPRKFNCAEYTGDYDDWTLPSQDDLLGMIKRQQETEPLVWLEERGFKNIQPMYYWSSTESKVNLYFA
ncbi:MAG: APHP protein, partial [uncultured bacterium]